MPFLKQGANESRHLMNPITAPYWLLAVESSAGPASCAILRVTDTEQTVWCESALNTKLTHSQTLLPMITDMLKNAGLTLADIAALAVAVGPGSFTGVRIGVAAVKGLAFANDLPCAAVSTLEGMAMRFAGMPYTGRILTAMDARCGQIYTALFDCDNGAVTRLTDDEALPLEEVAARLADNDRPLLAVGDGAMLTYEALRERVPQLTLAPPAWRFQHAVGVAHAAVKIIESGNAVSGDTLLPTYLRLPQAQRELRLRQNIQD